MDTIKSHIPVEVGSKIFGKFVGIDGGDVVTSPVVKIWAKADDKKIVQTKGGTFYIVVE